MTVNCTIESNIENDEVKQKAGHDLVTIQNIFADVANTHIDEWNSEWYSMHPELESKGMDPDTEEYLAYGKFWAGKCNEVLKPINNMFPKSTVIVQCSSIKGNPVIVGILKSDNSKFVFLGN